MASTIRTRQPRDWWNTIALGVLVVSICLMIGLNACMSSSRNTGNQTVVTAQPSAPVPQNASSPLTPQESVPASLANAGEFGENVYDYAKANDWKNANVKLAALREALNRVGRDVKNQSTAVDRLNNNVGNLDHALIARDRQAAMREANQVTVDVAEITTAYKLSVPVEVTRLDYYGRELEIWAQARDANKLQATARELRQTWNSLRPAIASHSAAEAKKFDALVARVESAKNLADYTWVASPVLNEVDNLEKLFQ
jgi:hypothetical protein